MPRGSGKLKRHPVTLAVGERIVLDDLVNDPSLSSKDRYQAIANRIARAIVDRPELLAAAGRQND